MSNDKSQIKGVQMFITKQSGFGNTSLFGTITIRHMLTLGLSILIGFLLMRTPLFKMNFFAMGAYIAFVSIILGQTPTGRNVLTNIYGILFKKPVNMLVTEDMTTTTMGHGISEVILDDHDIDAVPFRLASTRNIALVYSITSGINRWSTEAEKAQEAIGIKNLFNVLEGGESLMIVAKQNNDTGMLQLREDLLKKEDFIGDDLQRMSDRRAGLLYAAGTSEAGRSIQQYAILIVKPKNVINTTKRLREAARIITPAPNPASILFSVMGYEGGVEWTDAYSRENVRPEDEGTNKKEGER